MQAPLGWKKALDRLNWIGGGLMILGFPVSISISQLGLLIASITMIILLIGETRNPNGFKLNVPRWLVICVTCLFGFEFISICIAGISSGSWNVFTRGVTHEFKDVILVLSGVWVFFRIRNEDDERKVLRLLAIAIGILILTGLVSLFSKFRLARFPYHMLHGWVETPLARYQHHAGTFFTNTTLMFHVYMPIGMMNTHLTYAALLGMVLPLVTLRVLHPFVSDPIGYFRKWNVAQGWFLFSLLTTAIILFFNNGRSALMGAVVATLIGVVYFAILHWKKKTFLLLIPLAFVFVGFLLLYFMSAHLHDRLDVLFSALLGEKKHTDYQRLLVWQGAWELISNHPFFGVGAGQFETKIDEVLIGLSQKHPRLWYGYSVIQKGHAHNDLLHLWAIGGFVPVLAYLYLFFRYLYEILPSIPKLELDMLKWGPLLLLFGGLFQCYFQDDETLLPFWLIIGLGLKALDIRKK